jgi:RND family efflux transporter MFP subunit
LRHKLGVIHIKKYIITAALLITVVSWILTAPLFVKNSYKKVKAVKASTSSLVTTVECTGKIESEKTQKVVLGCQVKISKNNFNIGDKVKKGDKLLEIDKDITMQALKFGGVSTATEALQDSLGSDITPEKAQEALKAAMSQGIINQSTYDSIMEQFSSQASSNTQVSNSILQGSFANITDEFVNSLENSLNAPISGTLTSIVDGSTGINAPSSTLATIVDMDHLQVKAQVDEDSIKDVKVGQKALISGNGLTGKYSGVVKMVYPVAESSSNDTASNSVYVIISIDKPDRHIIPGLSANVSINVSKKNNTVYLPYDSIKQDDNGTEYVYIFDKGIAKRRNITTGIENDNGVEVLNGVNRGEIVIEDPSDTVRDGIKVQIV